MDVDPKIFVATVEKYNRFCQNGKDLEFGKDPAALIPIRTPPFYAFWGHRFQNDTIGGITISDNLEVLDNKGKVIHGLYAGGSCTTGSGALHRGWTAGFVAGTNVAKYLRSLG
jgi:predicted oxidoreductase